MARPSYAMGSSMNSMPAFWQVSISVARIGREASLMSVSPRQNFWNPPPVPDMPTEMSTFGFAFLNSSATASLMGKTVLDPSTRIMPLSSLLACSVVAPPPQPTARIAITTKLAVRRESFMALTLSGGNFALVTAMLNPCNRPETEPRRARSRHRQRQANEEEFCVFVLLRFKCSVFLCFVVQALPVNQ